MPNRHDDNDGSDIFWPGYVDATTNLILNLLFLLTILIVAVFMFALELGRSSPATSIKQDSEAVSTATAEFSAAISAATAEFSAAASTATADSLEVDSTAKAGSLEADSTAKAGSLEVDSTAKAGSLEVDSTAKAGSLEVDSTAKAGSLEADSTAKAGFLEADSTAKAGFLEADSIATAGSLTSESTATIEFSAAVSLAMTEFSEAVSMAMNDSDQEKMALESEIQRLNMMLAEQVPENEQSGGLVTTVDATASVPKPHKGLDKTLASDFEITVHFKDEAVAFTSAEHDQLLESLKAVETSGKASIYVEVPAGFSEAKRMGFYRAMAVRNLLIEMKLPPENIDVSVVEGASNSNASLVRVRSH